MNKREKWKPLFKILSTATIIGIECFIYWIAWVDYYNIMVAFPFWKKGIWLLVAIYGATLLLLMKIYGGLRIGYHKRGNIIYSHILSLIIANMITYFIIALVDRRFGDISPLIVMTAIEIVCIILWAMCFYYLYYKLFPPRKMVFVYGHKSSFHLLEKLSTREDKYQICEVVSIDSGLDKIYELIPNYDGVIIGDIKAEVRNNILKYCFEHSIRSYSVPKISDVILHQSEMLTLFDTPLFLNRNIVGSVEQIVWKRVLDIMVSGVALILLWPFFLIIILCIRIYDGGPAFYKQKRLTINGQEFEVLKFRSMIVNAEEDGVARLATESDNRITPIGNFLRKTRLDELPQIINILKGEMSVVGPRPERPEIAVEYEKEIPEFEFRLKVKAGLTGYAQVYGKYNTTPYDKLKLDLIYIEKMSLILDLKLILMTPKILFMKESTEGIENGAVDSRRKKDSTDLFL